MSHFDTCSRRLSAGDPDRVIARSPRHLLIAQSTDQHQDSEFFSAISARSAAVGAPSMSEDASPAPSAIE